MQILRSGQSSKNKQKKKWLKIQGGIKPTRYTVKKNKTTGEKARARTLFIPTLARRRILFEGDLNETVLNRGDGTLEFQWMDRDPGSGWPREYW